MFNVWIDDIQVVCLPAVIAPFEMQSCFLRKVRILARYTSVIVIVLFSLHCTRPSGVIRPGARTYSASEPWVMPADVFTESGEASWYGGNGDGFAGRPTASGELFDPAQPTCAHRTLPFGTLVEVENRETGVRATLRVNDRGPFVRGRILDVSRKGAALLGMMEAGVADIRMRSVDAGGRPAPLDPVALRGNPYTIQVAALSEAANIERLSKDLRAQFGPVTLQAVQARSGLDVKRVRVGSYLTLEEAQRAAEQIAKFFKDRNVEPFITRQR